MPKYLLEKRNSVCRTRKLTALSYCFLLFPVPSYGVCLDNDSSLFLFGLFAWTCFIWVRKWHEHGWGRKENFCCIAASALWGNEIMLQKMLAGFVFLPLHTSFTWFTVRDWIVLIIVLSCWVVLSEGFCWILLEVLYEIRILKLHRALHENCRLAFLYSLAPNLHDVCWNRVSRCLA